MEIFVEIREWIIKTIISILLSFIIGFCATSIFYFALKSLNMCSYNDFVCAVVGVICACIEFIECVVNGIEDIYLSYKIKKNAKEKKTNEDFDW